MYARHAVFASVVKFDSPCCVCVCVRERECVCVCVSMSVCKRESVCV